MKRGTVSGHRVDPFAGGGVKLRLARRRTEAGELGAVAGAQPAHDGVDDTAVDLGAGEDALQERDQRGVGRVAHRGLAHRDPLPQRGGQP